MRASSASEPKSKSTKKETATDWIKNMSPNKVIGDAQRILKTAVDVLEEEIAAGILAAKKLEKKVINVDEVRSTHPEELMSRIRRDVHDAVDIFLDAVTALTNHFSSLTETITKTKEATVALDSMKTAYNGATTTIGHFNAAAEGTKNFHEQVQVLTKNLGSLNAIYELELQDTSNHLKAMNNFYGHLTAASETMQNSVTDAKKAHDQIAKLAGNLTNLNTIYGNMLTAMQGRS